MAKIKSKKQQPKKRLSTTPNPETVALNCYANRVFRQRSVNTEKGREAVGRLGWTR